MKTSNVIRKAIERPAFNRELPAFMCHELWAMMNEGVITWKESKRALEKVKEAIWYRETLGTHYREDLGKRIVTNAMRRNFWLNYADFLDQKPCFLSKIIG